MPRKRKGLIIVHTGDGKGKTTAALGIAMRAAGNKMKVRILQFIKGDWHYGELDAAKQLAPYLSIEQMGAGFVLTGEKSWARDASEWPPEHREAAERGFRRCEEVITAGEDQVVIFDEINIVIDHGIFTPEQVLDLLAKKPEMMHVILTGRNAHPKIVEAADLVTEMRHIKHPFEQGILAQRGIEF